MPAAPRFEVPDICQSDDGWGPSASSVPEHLADVPFAPFGKGDKIGRASDWTPAAYQKFSGRYQQGQVPAVFNFFHNEEEESFHLVDNRPVKTTKFGNRRYQNRFQQRGQRDRDGRGMDRNDRTKKQEQQKRAQFQNYGRDQQRMNYSSSVEIKPDWAVIEQIPFQALVKLNCMVGEPEDVVRCGALEYYDKAYDRITVRQETPLEKTRRVFRNVSTSDDPVIRRVASENKAKVFATDSVLTTLMCMKSSRYSWDLIVTKKDGKIFIDKRPNSNLNLLTVNETSPEDIPEDKDNINGLHQLALEATAVNQNFSQQVLAKNDEKMCFEEENPFPAADDEELASCGYRYRKWRLNDEEDIDIIVRCELDGAINNKGENQLLSIKALNEIDISGQNWRKRVDSQRGAAILAFETKSNKNKVAKWTAAALLAGADMIKLGYVSRGGPRDNLNHVILTTQVCKPKEFAGQINLNMEHCWGIIRALIDMLMKQDDGKYLLVKDPMKELIRVYAVPQEAFEMENNYADEASPEDEANLEPTPLVE